VAGRAKKPNRKLETGNWKFEIGNWNLKHNTSRSPFAFRFVPFDFCLLTSALSVPASVKCLSRTEGSLANLLQEPLERLALGYGITRRVPQSVVRFRQAVKIRKDISPRVLKAWPGPEPPAIAHHGVEQRCALRRFFAGACDQIMMIMSASREPEDLLPARRIDFLFAGFALVIHMPVVFDLNQFVDHVERRDVARGGEIGPHAEEVDGRSLGKQGFHLVLVQIPAGHDLRLTQAVTVQDFPNPAARYEEVTAIDAYAGNLPPERGRGLRSCNWVIVSINRMASFGNVSRSASKLWRSVGKA